MEKAARARNSYWDNLKGILILLVVCGHLCERYIDDSGLLRHIWIVVYSFHMPLFIFVNGYFARKSTKPAAEKSLKMLKYYLLMQVLFMFGNHWIRGAEFELAILAEPAYCCWYLIFLVYAYLFMKFLPDKKTKVVKWVAVSLVLSLLVGFDVSVGHPYGVGRTFYFLPYFFLGALWADTGREIKTDRQRKIICAVLAVLIFLVLWKLGDAEWFNRSVFSGHQSYERLYPDHRLFGLLNKTAAYAAAAVIGFLVLHLVPRRRTILCFLGRHTLLIYLVHIFVLPMEFHLIRDIEFVGEKELNSAVILLILAVTSAIICYVLSVSYRFVILNLMSKIKKGEVFERRAR